MGSPRVRLRLATGFHWVATGSSPANPRYRGRAPWRARPAHTEGIAPRNEYPSGSPDGSPQFYGLSAKRYCLFARDRSGRPHVFRKSASDHGLGVFEAPSDREEFIASVWEAILNEGPTAPGLYSGIPATARFSLSAPTLTPRVRKLGPIRPFTLLTARFLEPSADPAADRSELIPYVDSPDEAVRSQLMQLPRQRSWGSVLDAFARHRDRKYLSDEQGRMVRRHVLIRRSKIAGLGKEANRIGDARVLGHAAAGGRPKTYLDWKERLLKMGRAEARALGLPGDFVMRAKRRVKAKLPLRRDAAGRLRAALSLVCFPTI